ncbi:MAG: PBP1A family penicillin-binding protein, partial [Pseudomonadota bacterium]
MLLFYSGKTAIQLLFNAVAQTLTFTLSKYRFLIPLSMWSATLFMVGWIVVSFLLVQLQGQLPDANGIRSVELKIPLRVYSADNLLISEFGNERRKPLAIEEFPQTLVDAVLASEDDAFYSHRGIDFFGLIRAVIVNFRDGAKSQGASTITMQVARNFYLSAEQTYTRKIKEILLALKLEQILSKDEILSLYLNKIFLGHRAYGFGAAADVYYGTALNNLNLAQHAMLAGVPKAPSSYNPLRNPVRAMQRRNYVLGRMHELELISDLEYEDALAAPVSAEKHAKSSELDAPHIAEMVRAQLTQEFGEGAYWAGLNVYTTILSNQQRNASQTLRSGLHDYDRRHGFRGPVKIVDLESLEVDLSDPATAYEGQLTELPTSLEQRPALILSVERKLATVYVKGAGIKELRLADARWARRHKTANLLDDWLSDFSQAIEPGQVVYVMPRKVEEETEPTSTNEVIEALAQDSAEVEAVPAYISAEYQLSQLPQVSGALISIEPTTGRIYSLVGGYDFFLNKYNRAVQSIRQPGSNIKPFIYSASLDKGFTPASLISGAPIVMTDPAHGTVWRPENYSGKFYGPTRMRAALGQSMNLVSIRLLRSIGIPFAKGYLDRFGIVTDRFASSLTMALGSGGVTPLEMLSAYSVLANGGYRVEPYFIERIEDREGRVIYRAPQAVLCDACYEEYLPLPEPEEIPVEDEPLPEQEVAEALDQDEAPLPIADDEPSTPIDDVIAENYEAPRVMSRANNFLTVSMLKDVITRGTAKKALALNRIDLAGKTGTTNDYVDAWFTGFNSKVATTVWIGFDEPAT